MKLPPSRAQTFRCSHPGNWHLSWGCSLGGLCPDFTRKPLPLTGHENLHLPEASPGPWPSLHVAKGEMMFTAGNPHRAFPASWQELQGPRGKRSLCCRQAHSSLAYNVSPCYSANPWIRFDVRATPQKQRPQDPPVDRLLPPSGEPCLSQPYHHSLRPPSVRRRDPAASRRENLSVPLGLCSTIR